MPGYHRLQSLSQIPRIPLRGSIDLTYRCNNICRHCWLWLAENAAERATELSSDEIVCIIDQARALGCREWSISGGEPMLRPDFPEVLEHLTRKAVTYSLNTNGTLITPQIAQLLKRQGSKMIALYGATAETYDYVTRHKGGFEKAMRGFRYMQEAGAGFTVQLVPMRDNWHEWERMQELAKSLSGHWRVGASWLYFSSSGSPTRNREIAAQRLAPRDVVELDQPDPAYGERIEELGLESGRPGEQERSSGLLHSCPQTPHDDRLFAHCIASRRDFHIDPYGQMTWCSFIKDPALRYDLRRGTFREAWEEFIPSCADKVRGGDEWRENCGGCDKRGNCRWCAVYAYLETKRYSARVPYLCAVADEARAFEAEWRTKHRRYFRIAGITVRVESDLDFDSIESDNESASCIVEGPGDDNVTLQLCFGLPDLTGKDLGEELCRRPPWAVSQPKNGTWIYRAFSPDGTSNDLRRVAVFSADHSHGTIYTLPRDRQRVLREGWHSLSQFLTDEMWLAPLLVNRNALLLHSAAAIVNGQGLMFVGNAKAETSTMMEMLKATRDTVTGSRLRTREGRTKPEVETLYDERSIVRKWHSSATSGPQSSSPQGWRVYGAWSHGEAPGVSSAPLCAILFLRQDTRNEIVPLTDREKIWQRLLVTLVRPMVIAGRQQKDLNVLEQIVEEVRCYAMRFDASGAILEGLRDLIANGA